MTPPPGCLETSDIVALLAALRLCRRSLMGAAAKTEVRSALYREIEAAIVSFDRIAALAGDRACFRGRPSGNPAAAAGERSCPESPAPWGR
jgi:hypothetical protein